MVRSLRIAALAGVAALVCPAPVRAETTTLEAVTAPIVRINLPGGDVTIRTWPRSTVAVDGPATLVVQRRLVHVAAEQIPLFIPGAGRTPDGRARLPAESFVVASIPFGPREQIVIKMPPGAAPGGAPLTVTLPADAVFVSARTGNGNLDVDGYRGGTFVGFTTRGRLALSNFAGTAFVQTGRGPLRIGDSSFDRLRARTVAGNMVFERCHVREIEATSVSGTLVYDAGTFEPGLARFESASGQIAIGTRDGAVFAGHAGGSGKVFTNFERVARAETRDGGTTAYVAGGGPLVTATTLAASVFFYDGSLRERAAALSGPWRGPLATLARPARQLELRAPAQPGRRRVRHPAGPAARADQHRALAP